MPVDIPEYFKKCTITFNVHCLPKNLHRKIEPVLVGAIANGICLVSVPAIPYCCICSLCDRLGFYAEIQIIFGPV